MIPSSDGQANYVTSLCCSPSCTSRGARRRGLRKCDPGRCVILNTLVKRLRAVNHEVLDDVDAVDMYNQDVQAREIRGHPFFESVRDLARPQPLHDPVHHFAHLDMALVPAGLGGARITGATCAHSSFVRSLGYRNRLRS